MPKPRQTAPRPIVDTNELTKDELYAHCKRTAPGLDLAFFLHATITTLRPDLRERGVLLLAETTETDGTLIKGSNRAEFYRRLTGIQDEWRRDRNAAEFAESRRVRELEASEAVA